MRARQCNAVCVRRPVPSLAAHLLIRSELVPVTRAALTALAAEPAAETAAVVDSKPRSRRLEFALLAETVTAGDLDLGVGENLAC